MNAPRDLARPLLELIDSAPAVSVEDAEYRRLLGYPKDHIPGERVHELAAWARRTYAELGRPWVYLRETDVQISDGTLRLDGVEFHSRQLYHHLREAGVQRAMLMAVSAGRACEERARELWQESKPDEYFFLEIFGSAVVENLVATTNARICDLAERDGLIAIPHYSPGYTGWEVAEQNKLFELIDRGRPQPFPESIEVLSSGMLRPKKSLLAVVGLTLRTETALASSRLVPCEACAFSPCRYRRAAYRHAPRGADTVLSSNPLTPNATYTVNSRALRKWAQERVQIAPRKDGSLTASFRFDGTTCSNMGRPIAFDYVVRLSGSGDGYQILESDCRPAPDDEGHKFMCSYLSDADGLMNAIATEKPLLGRPLNEVLKWTRTAAPSGCHCDAYSRAHKWGLALEVIHFALVQNASAPVSRS